MLLITISGLDGAGKSTLIKALADNLEARRYRVAVVHLNHDVGVYAFLQSVRDFAGRALPHRSRANRKTRLRGTPTDAPNGRGATGLARRMLRAVIWNRSLRQVVFLVDLLAFGIYRFRMEKLRRTVLIADRYFYDRLVDLADGRRWGVLRLLFRCTPEPSVAVLVDVPPEVASSRKAEYSVGYLQSRWQAYQQVFDWLRSPVLLRNDDLKSAVSQLERTVLDRMPA